MDEGRTKHIETGRASSLMFMTGIRRETTLLKKALLISLIFHMLLFWIVFPATAGGGNKAKEEDTLITQFIPPPPKKEQPKVRRVLVQTKAAIIPDPTPDAPEPASDYQWEEDDSVGPLGEADWIYDAGDRGPILADGVKVKLPECYHKVIPLYPELARKARIRGSVVIQAIWDTNGRITGAKVISSPGKQFGFDDAALAALKEWKCYPATLSGRKVEVYGTVTVNFTMP